MRGAKAFYLTWSLVLTLAGKTVVAAVLPLAPVISEREARLLETSMDLSSTNVVAAIRFLETQRTTGESAAIAFTIGNFYFQQEAMEEAIEAYKEAIDILPSFRDARKNLGRAWLLLDDHARAIQVFRHLIKEGHSDEDIFLLLGHGLMREHHAVPAETAYRQALMLNPELHDAKRGLLQSLLEQERLKEARSLVRNLLEDAPDNASYWSLRINIEAALDRHQMAIQSAETARRLGRANASLMMLLGDLYLSEGHAAAAFECYMEAQRSEELPVERLLRAVEALVAMAETSRAQTLMSQIEDNLQRDTIAFRDHQAQWMRLKAEIARIDGHTDKAMVLYQEAVHADPLDGGGWLRYGDLLRENNRFEEAEVAYERAMRLTGYRQDALIRLAGLDAQTGRYDDAVARMENALRLGSRPDLERYYEQLRRLADRR